jgi:chloramphenicol 3-O phosphotransferase
MRVHRKRICVQLFLIFTVCLAFSNISYAKESIIKGTVIILNGPSASGKSSIQKKIQEHFDEPYMALGVDVLFDGILPDYYGLGEIHPKGKFKEKDIRWVETMEFDDKKAIKLFIGPIGRKVISGMHYSIAAYANQGNNVVVDYILYEKNWFPELVDTLEGIKVYYVGIQYSLSEIEKREAKRATSPVGHARSHYDTVHYFDKYDLVIKNSKLSAEEIALKIKAYVKNNPKPKAFEFYTKNLEKKTD